MRFGVLAAVLSALVVVGGCGSATTMTARLRPTAAHGPQPPRQLTARPLRARPGALARGTAVGIADLFGDRVFVNSREGFALANRGSAQYPAISTDGGHRWRIDGPQVHVDAADAAEGVGLVGAAWPHTFFAYGSSAVDVTTNGGRTWWEAFLGELVMAVVVNPRGDLVAYVQQSVSNDRINPSVTWQYVSRDGGRHWSYNTALGGLSGQ